MSKNNQNVNETIIEEIDGRIRVFTSRRLTIKNRLEFADMHDLTLDEKCEFHAMIALLDSFLSTLHSIKSKIPLRDLKMELLNNQEEVLCRPIRFNGVSIQKIHQVFQRYGIDENDFGF